jgi:carboxymethylenebutenolidase
MKENYVSLNVEDGSEMQAYVARPSGTPKAGVMVFQEAFGVNPYIRDIADRFAKEGYLAIAPELYHRTAPGLEAGYDDFPSIRPHIEALTTEGIEADAKATYERLVAEGTENVTCIGFCMGGRVSYIANSALPLRAAVSFYGAGVTPELLARAANLSAPMLFFWGGLDTHIPREMWSKIPEAIEAAGKEHITVEFGAANHGFFCDQRSAYHQPSAELAWPLVLNFMAQKLGSKG